ncbi:MAG: hypothetical protein HOV80_22380 [Polyangiaceae bacterium]|nr:hypothetical protein [Polyangiaceae bacterium]
MSIELAFATPRKLPKARDLRGRVAVLDIAFASETGGASFETVTLPFIQSLGSRLVVWVDHHDSDNHARFASDPRFVLAKKSEHGACPEMITPELVERIGPIDTLVCHNDFDGLASAAKWMRGGIESYPGCDDDARAVDTRIGTPSAIGLRFDRALRGRPRDAALFGVVVRHLSSGLADASLWEPIDQAGKEFAAVEEEARRLAHRYKKLGDRVVYVDATQRSGPYDKTLLLLLGQERAPISVVLDGDSLTIAAAFDSGLNFLKLLGLSGGMPTRVTVPKKRLGSTLLALGVAESDIRLVDASGQNY